MVIHTKSTDLANPPFLKGLRKKRCYKSTH